MAGACSEPCPVCGEAETRFLAEKDGYAFARCPACGYAFLDPMPTAAELAAQYRGDGASGETYPKARSRLRRALVRAARYAPFYAGREALDLGCGGGFMVEAMRRFGARASGVDIDVGGIAYARRRFPKARFFCEDFASFAARGERFAFVHCAEVIEHLPEAEPLMAALARLTRPGGRVFLTTPDIGHPAVPAEITRWDMFSPPRHVQFLTERALALLAARHGFAVLRRRRKRAPSLQVLLRRRTP